ncbi:hypothetical protein [uncultured Aquimarina sp.]|uniref:hypothetical protein n=1 Tax=uncultured Aquimarina sp. TaxID=575652 RepID=UPI002605C544|nr:hypothetical protein [uncultured Aquimarina sp.]
MRKPKAKLAVEKLSLTKISVVKLDNLTQVIGGDIPSQGFTSCKTNINVVEIY